MRAVLDANVLVSAAISPAGPPRQILAAWIQERFELIASPALLDELVDVLARPKFRRFITTAVAAEFIDGLATDAIVVADPPEPPEVSPDPDDDYLIALARVAARRLPRSPATGTFSTSPTWTCRCSPAPIPRPARDEA